ncbi:MAG TPA: hypothetical protein VEK11_21500 [Thermoanaerobaculia bacterium]|nr:hypothetical protein [Thermoanaerobaculia bacterium]
MKKHTRRAAAIVLAVALSISPAAFGAVRKNQDGIRDIPERIVKVIKKIQQRLFGGVSVSDDLPLPPRP